MIAFDAGIRAGDYEAWSALFADGVGNLYGGDVVTDQRKQERYQFDARRSTIDPVTDFRCIPNGAVERSWTCTMQLPEGR